MRPEVGRPRWLAAVAPCAVRNVAKDRLLLSGLVLAALPVLFCSIPWTHEALETSLHLHPWAHLTLEASLNLLWVALAVAAFLQWAVPARRSHRVRLAGLVSLVFALALLFPVISANDDLAEFELINDASTSRAVTLCFKSHKQLPSPAATLTLSAASDPEAGFHLPFLYESVPEPTPVPSVTTPGDATGNHSPPLG